MYLLYLLMMVVYTLFTTVFTVFTYEGSIYCTVFTNVCSKFVYCVYV